ncbi:hydrolase [Hymenobacter busanensis]|uniref:Hydrolase n=1 Tax=Hymenobacter busanensis TaxID=2607656 RepID=A0A7L5A329_9BACT|nr:hydrolase [Hymenobacter busanensis]KAA9333095.1 hydrolase [Hymenobacter busanensis]QHJ08230.1 hydrolase [Hymenobacter busanensis]
MSFFTPRSWWAAPLLALAVACAKTDVAPPTAPLATALSQHVSNTGFPEGFESGTKTAYTLGSVTLGSGSWTLDDALLGNTTADPKTGAQSARIRNVGSLSMNFDVSGGAGVVTVGHALYGTDGSSTWELWASTNGGSSYSKVGSTITTSSTMLQTASFTANLSGSVRLQIRKVSGGTNRLNIDNVDIQTYSGGGGGTGAKKFLIDASHAEMAGNADWVLDVDAGVAPRFPTPAASGITATTAETYWTGALSAWGVSLVKLGHSVENLPTGTAITYGNSSNAQDLSNYNVFIVDEPNTVFTSAEKTAILQFVQNGGGLFMISDHDVSDRNNDGWDSPAIWNDLMTNNAVQTNPFGFSIALSNISETTSNVLNSSTNQILNGPQGAVTQLKYSNGATITTNSAAAKGLIWRTTSSQGSTNVMCASSTYGTGRVVVVADSSPADDGTGSPGNTVYPGWTELASHARLHMNASLWLAKVTN